MAIRLKDKVKLATGLNTIGPIDGLTLAGGGINGSNYNISGVNQVSIADPGEGIVFGGGSAGSITLAVVDDSNDDILRISGTGVELQVGTNRVLTTADSVSNSDTVDNLHAASFFRADAADVGIGFYTSAGINGTSDAGLGIANGGRLGFDQSGTRSWTIKATGGTLDINSGDGNGNLTFAGNTFWHAGNDGASSGLDADLLDGVQGASYLRSDADDTFTGHLTATGRIIGNRSDENLRVSGIRGQAKGSQSGEYIHLYERVHIGGPSGWGASSHGAPANGLSLWGSINVGQNGSGVIQLDDTTIIDASKNAINLNSVQEVTYFSTDDTQSRGKLRLWTNSDTYAIGMKSGFSYGHIGGTGTEYAMSFQMNNDSSRGFWWGDSSHSDAQGAASLTTDGKMVIAKSLSIGEGETVTSPSTTPLYAKGDTSGSLVVDIHGTQGQLFSISDYLEDSLFSVNDISGIPILDVQASGKIIMEGTDLEVHGNILLTGTTTTTNAGRMIDFTGFDKEGVTDFSDRAYIQHTTNTGGHAGSVLVISSQNDSGDGSAFLTNASSPLKHNTHTIWTAGNDGAGTGLDADLLDGVQGANYLRSDVEDQGHMLNLGGEISPSSSAKLQVQGFMRTGPIMIAAGNTSTSTFNDTNEKWLMNNAGTLYIGDGTNYTDKILTSADEGSGNGIDADTVDGLHEGSFTRKGSTSANDVGSITTFNSNDLGNSTGGSQSSLQIYNSTAQKDAFLTFHISGDYAGYFGLDGSTNDLFWGGWSVGNNKHKIWHAGNDGAGSGLDADTVDGINAASFLRSDAADTAAGVINFTAGHGAVNITNSSILSSATSTWTGNPGGAGKIQYHSNRWYIVSDSSSNRIVQFRRDGSDKSYIDNDGNFVGTATSAGNADTVDSLHAADFLRSNAQDSYTPKRLDIGASSNWDAVGFAYQTNVHLQGHNQFWIGAGNGTWFEGTANTKSSTAGLAADASTAHDLLISTMQGTSATDRGITFAVDSTGAGNDGWRLGKWHSSNSQASSKLTIDGGLHVRGGDMANYDYYADDYSSYWDNQGGQAYWGGDTGWIDPSITAGNAIQIQAGNKATHASNPALQFHQYGYGGIQLRYDGPNDAFHMESTGTNRFDNLQITTDHGNIQIGPMNTSHAHIYTDRTNFYFNKELQINGGTVVSQTAVTSAQGTFTNLSSTNNIVGRVNGVANRGFGSDELSYYQSSANFAGVWTSGWASHIIGNHGNGSTYYNQIIHLPFWGPPQYSRQEGNTSTRKGPFAFCTSEASFTTAHTIQAGTLRATADVVAYYSSDKRLKDNIIPIGNAIDKIKQIGGYEFDWNDKQENFEGHDYGVIAQEVEKVLPELVKDREDGFKGVRYEKLTSVLIQGIKEQQETIENQQKQIDDLKEIVGKLINNS